jgi:hypothetical protein
MNETPADITASRLPSNVQLLITANVTVTLC